MQIVDNALILLVVFLAFYFGKRISDSYNAKIIDELHYQLRISAAREGVGYIAPVSKKRMPIGQPFMDKLKENGRATQQIRTPQTP